MNPHQSNGMLDQMFIPAHQAGAHVPEDVLLAMERQFPEVQLLWNVWRRRWWLVQTLRGGKRQPFRELGTETTYAAPTMENTVKHVARLAAIRSKRDRDVWLAELDRTAGTEEVDKRFHESIHEGNSELIKHVFNNRTLVQKPWDSN